MMDSITDNIFGAVIGGTLGGQRQRSPGAQESQSTDSHSQSQNERARSRNNRPNQYIQQPPFASLRESAREFGYRALDLVLKGVQYLLLVDLLFVSAGAFYGVLYWLIMPLKLHDQPLYLDYSNRYLGGPTATVDFLAQHTQWNPSPLTHVERLHGRVLKPGQHYEVGLELLMPTSLANRREGVFMIEMTLFDEQDNELAQSARAAMLPHTSGLLKGIRIFCAWPLYLLGFTLEADTVHVPCFDFYEENALHPLTKARVVVSNRHVQFYRASVHVTPQLKGLPWLMHNWFYTSLVAGVLFIASLELMVFGFGYLIFFLGDASKPSSRGTHAVRGGSNTNTKRGPSTTPYSSAPTVARAGSVVADGRNRARQALDLQPDGDSSNDIVSIPRAETGAGLRRRQVVASVVGTRFEPVSSTRVMSSTETFSREDAFQRPGEMPDVALSASFPAAAAMGTAGSLGGSASLEISREERDAAAMASWAALGNEAEDGGSDRSNQSTSNAWRLAAAQLTQVMGISPGHPSPINADHVYTSSRTSQGRWDDPPNRDASHDADGADDSSRGEAPEAT